MKRAYSVSSYAKLYEKYCKENLPSDADDIFKKADEYYREFMRRDMPDLGKNMMAANMYDWFTIVSSMRQAVTGLTARFFSPSNGMPLKR